MPCIIGSNGAGKQGFFVLFCLFVCSDQCLKVAYKNSISPYNNKLNETHVLN